ncbi:MAG: BtpA/SgcQ family protein [Trueperaceae bacterium]
MKKFNKVFGRSKPIIAMAHLPPLPGSPLYDKEAGIDGIVDAVVQDIEALQQGGVDAIMFGNEGDRPYLTKATPESLTAMTAVVTRCLPHIEVPYGVNYLWDPVASVALAHATGALWVREVFTGVYDADMGLWAPDAASAVRLRHNLGDDCLLLYNINAEFASPMGTRSNSAKAKSAVFASLADAICVSGPMTGEAVELSNIREVKDALPDTPVIANTGVRVDNVKEILGSADAAIVGTSFKKDGITWNGVDTDRVARFMDTVNTIR